MPQFTVDEDLAALVERLAKPKPFENLSFNQALRRVLNEHIKPKADKDIEELEELLAQALAEAKANPKKLPSPSASTWASSVSELKKVPGLTTWKAICNHLHIDTAGDSARRRLRNWVRNNRPNWPNVPEAE